MENNFYPNIVYFLSKNDFKITKIENLKIGFCFSDAKYYKLNTKYRDLVANAKNCTDLNKSQEFLRKSSEFFKSVSKSYFPKLEPVLELLNEFYSNRKIDLEFKLHLDNIFFGDFSIGGSDSYREMFVNKSLFDDMVKIELEALDLFTKISYRIR